MSRHIQTQIPVEDKINPPTICGWCDATAVDEVVLEKERYRYEDKNGKKVKLVAKHAITAGVCQDHKNILDKQPSNEKPDNYKVKR